MAQDPVDISIIIPTYNREKFLGTAIESALSQMPIEAKIEIIVVDDGSTDSTSKLVDKYKNRIRYLRIPHSGKPAVARNSGASIARGKYLAFLDSDDEWIRGKLQYQYRIMEKYDVDVLCGEVIELTDKAPPKTIYGPSKIHSLSFSGLVKTNQVNTLTVMMKKSVFDELGGFPESDQLRVNEDYFLWLKAASSSYSLSKTEKVLARYRVHSGNISKDSHLDAIKKLLVVYDQIWPHITNKVKLQILEKQIFSTQLNFSRMADEMAYKIPDISVVMSMYNAEKFLKVAVDSILSQTESNFEFIIIDDGSMDSSFAIIEGYKDSRIRIIRQTNHGLVYSLNKGIHIARAKYIARMDADDISDHKRFECQLAWIRESDDRVLVSSCFSLISYDEGMEIGTRIIFPNNTEFIRDAFLYTNPIAHGGSMYRKDIVTEVGLYRDTYGPTEDYDLWRRIPTKYTIGILPDTLFFYRINNPLSISQSKNDVQQKFVEKIRNEQWSIYHPKINALNNYKYYKKLRIYDYDSSASLADVFISHFYTITSRAIILRKKRAFLNGIITICLIKPSLLIDLAKVFSTVIIRR